MCTNSTFRHYPPLVFFTNLRCSLHSIQNFKVEPGIYPIYLLLPVCIFLTGRLNDADLAIDTGSNIHHGRRVWHPLA